MQNLTMLKRNRMLKFLEEIRKVQHADDVQIAIGEIENELTKKNMGLFGRSIKKKSMRI